MASHRRRHQFALKEGGRHAGAQHAQARRRWLRWALVCAAAAAFVFAVRGVSGSRVGQPAAAASGGSAELAPREEQADITANGASAEEEDDGLVDACAEVLERYESVPGCTPAYAGYIDLFGDVWACLVFGEGWAEISVVHKSAGGTPQTKVFRFDASGLQALVGDGS